MISKELGPLGIFSRFRADRAAKQQKVGGLFDMVSCVACLSVYIGAVTALWLAHGVLSWIGYTFAFSAVAMILEALYERIKSNKPLL